jgi:NAD-dependent deacetylase
MSIEQAIEYLQEAEVVLAFIGAGMSKESGIDTFRDEEGNFIDQNMEKMLHKRMMDRDPQAATRYYREFRVKALEGKEPNAGHYALAEISQYRDLTIATQNIDGLTERAVAERGYDPVPIAYLHGTLNRMKCHGCHVYSELELGDTCECGDIIRPDIVLYGEPLDDEVFYAAEIAAEAADVCLILGTSGQVFPASSIPQMAYENGAKVIEVNPGSTALAGYCDVIIRDKTGTILPQFAEALRP